MHLSRTFARGLKALLVVSSVGAAASALEMVLLYHPGVNITRLYFGTDTHAQSILVGAVLACVMTMVQMRRGAEGMAPQARGWPARAALVALGAAGLAGTLILTYTLTGTDAFDYRGGFTLSALSAAAIIMATICVPGGPIARGLAIFPLVWLGTISYGAYLWHYPIYIFLDASRTGLSGGWLLALRFVATFTVAAISYYVVERPIMVGTFWRSLRAMAPAAVAMVVTVVVIVAGTAVPATAAVVTHPDITAGEHRALEAAGAFGRHPIRFLLVGDSIADTMAQGLGVDTVRRYGVRLDNQSDLGCDLDDLHAISGGVETDPVSPCAHWQPLWRGDVRADRPDVVGFLMGRWDITDHIDDQGQIVHIGEPAWNAHLEDELEQVVTVLSSTGAKVVFFTMPDLDPPPTPNGATYDENSPIRVSEWNSLLDVRRPEAEPCGDGHRPQSDPRSARALPPGHRRRHRAVGRRDPHLAAGWGVAATGHPSRGGPTRAGAPKRALTEGFETGGRRVSVDVVPVFGDAAVRQSGRARPPAPRRAPPGVAVGAPVVRPGARAAGQPKWPGTLRRGRGSGSTRRRARRRG